MDHFDNKKLTCEFEGKTVEFTVKSYIASEDSPWQSPCVNSCTRTTCFKVFEGNNGTTLCTMCMAEDGAKYLPVIEAFEALVRGH